MTGNAPGRQQTGAEFPEQETGHGRYRNLANTLRPVAPRNPQIESTIGQAKESRHGESMRNRLSSLRKQILSWSMIASVAMAAIFVFMLAAPTAANAGVFVRVGFAPPLLPVYVQPICPGDGYIWQPGYWAYGPDGYYWVDGAWVVAPYVGALWTPGYWGYGGGFYFWHAGYWGARVGYYGGINYGFGYFGVGYRGGYWKGGHFFSDRAYNNIREGSLHNTFGGPGGGVHPITARSGFAGGNHVVASNNHAAATSNFSARGSYSGNAGYSSHSYSAPSAGRGGYSGGGYSGGVSSHASSGGGGYHGGGGGSRGGGGGGRR
jgi:hypothetical protein